MKMLVRAIASLLLCAAAVPALAQQARPVEAASSAELLKWKKDVLDRYKQVVYLNAGHAPISESEFLQALRERHAAFSMTHEAGNLERIVVRLLGPEEVAQERTGAAS